MTSGHLSGAHGATQVVPAEAMQPLPGQLAAAFDHLDRGFNQLLEIGDRGDFMALGPDGLIDLARKVESHRSRLAALDTGIVEAAEQERLVEHTRARSTAGALAEVLHISMGEARGRVERAKQLMPQNAFSAGVRDCEHPALNAAVRAGEISSGQLRVVGESLKKLSLNPAVSAEDTTCAEQALVDNARAFGPDDLKRIAAKIYDALIPDGALPRDELAQARRGIEIGPEGRDGTHLISGQITRELRAKLHAVLSPLAAPRPAGDASGPDARTPAQRLHDAMLDAANRLLDSQTLPRSGGTPATIHLNVDVDRLIRALQVHNPDLPSGRAIARTALGDDITLAELLRTAAEAEIIPTFATAADGVIAYGRDRRIATKNQTNALISRDGGCSFPSCNAPPEWCDRHHVIPWVDGGPTDLSNMTLVCGYHHREFENRGWSVQMIRGIPAWIPSRFADPEQRPVINARIASRLPADPFSGINPAELAEAGVAESRLVDASVPAAVVTEIEAGDEVSAATEAEALAMVQTDTATERAVETGGARPAASGELCADTTASSSESRGHIDPSLAAALSQARVVLHRDRAGFTSEITQRMGAYLDGHRSLVRHRESDQASDEQQHRRSRYARQSRPDLCFIPLPASPGCEDNARA